MRARTRNLTAALGLVLGTSVLAVPAGAADTDDSFTSENSPPTIEIVSVSALDSNGDQQGDSVWYPTVTDVEVVYTVSDANTLAGSTSTICFTNDGVCVAGMNGFDEAGYFVSEDTNTTASLAKITSGTWGATTQSISQLGTWDSTSVTFTLRVTVGAIARATALGGTWSVLAIVDDGSDSDSDISSGHTVADYVTMSGSILDRDFGTIGAGSVSSPISRTLTGIKANTNWDVSVEVVDDKFVDGDVSEALPDIALDTDGSPSGYRFSLRCDGTASPTTAGVYVGTSATPVWTDGAPFTSDVAATQDIGCVIYNGQTPSGRYQGVVRTTLSVGS